MVAFVDVGGTLWPDSWPRLDGDGQEQVRRLTARVRGLPQERATELVDALSQVTHPSSATQQTDRLVMHELRRCGLAGLVPVEAVIEAMCLPAAGRVDLFPGARRLLRGLASRTPVVIVSNTLWRRREALQSDFAHLGVAEYVSDYVTSIDIGWRKPHPRIFDAALAAVGAPAERGILLGDSETNDIEPARSRGMVAIRVAIEVPRPTTSAAQHVVASLDEAAELLLHRRGGRPLTQQRGFGAPEAARHLSQDDRLGSGIMFWGVEQLGRVAVATFTRPPRNMMSFEAMTELEGVARSVAEDSSVSVLVLTGGLPGYFVAHADLEDLVALGQGREVKGDPGSWARTLALFEAMPQPVVAAINGQAWGGGCELSLACTLRVMAESAHVAQPEVNVGIIPGAGGTQRLPRLIGVGSAAELILSGRTVGSAEALARGFAQAVLPDERFKERVLEWLEPIAAKPRTALVAAKRSVVEGQHLPLSEGLRLEGRLFVELQSHETAITLEGQALERYAAAGPDERIEL